MIKLIMNHGYKCRCAPPRKLLDVHHRNPPPVPSRVTSFKYLTSLIYLTSLMCSTTPARNSPSAPPLSRASGRAAGTFSLSYGGKREGGGGMTL